MMFEFMVFIKFFKYPFILCVKVFVILSMESELWQLKTALIGNRCVQNGKH